MGGAGAVGQSGTRYIGRNLNMAATNDLKKLAQDLRDTTFILGGFRRKAAVKALVERRNEPGAVSLLIEALRMPELSGHAAGALRELSSPAAIDVLCAEAARQPQGLAAKLCVEMKYQLSDQGKVYDYLFLTRQMEELAKWRNEPPATALLLKAFQTTEFSNLVRACLMDLTSPAAIDFLCAEAERDSTGVAAKVCVERKYRPSAPGKVCRYFFNTGQIDELGARRNEPEATALLLEALQNPLTARTAGAALRDLSSSGTANLVCNEAMRNPQGEAAKLCLARKYRPSDHEKLCLYLFVTNQLDEYFKEDFEFQNLRLQYDRADERLRSLVMNVVRGGDRRCLPFIIRPRKALRECTEEEIKLALKSCLQHQDWNRLLTACLELPAKYSFPAWDRFRLSGWAPEDPALASVYKQILTDSTGETVAPPSPPQARSGVFERWLAEGRKPELANASEPELVNRLKTATPPEGVPIVAALAARPKCEESTVKAVAENEHWLVRLAGLATGLARDIVSDGRKDSNYWVNELAGAAGVLEFWPRKATPADLEKLKNAPAEAFGGKLGAVRKVLRTIMGYRVTIGTFIEPDIQPGETDAEFVIAD